MPKTNKKKEKGLKTLQVKPRCKGCGRFLPEKDDYHYCPNWIPELSRGQGLSGINPESPKDKVKRLLREALQIKHEINNGWVNISDEEVVQIARMIQIEENKRA